MRIGIDIDGVLYPWDECARDALVAKFAIERPGPSTHWNYLKEVIAPDQWRWLWTREGQDASFGHYDRAYPGVREAFAVILRSGHECHFVTHRDPRRTAFHTAMFLERNFERHPWAGVHIVQAATPKTSIATWDVFIDDKPDTVMDMLIQTRAQVFSPVRDWNTELAELGTGRLTRYVEPREVAEWVLAQ